MSTGMKSARRRLEAALLAAALGMSLAVTAGLAQSPEPERARALVDLVRQDCGSCHGMTLKGGLGRALGPEQLKDFDGASLAAIILDGVPNTPMPPWRGLITEPEARWIADRLIEGFPK